MIYKTICLRKIKWKGVEKSKSLCCIEEEICAEDVSIDLSSLPKKEGWGEENYKCRVRQTPTAQGSRYQWFLSWIQKFQEAKVKQVYQVASFPHPKLNLQIHVNNIMRVMKLPHRNNTNFKYRNCWSSYRCVCLWVPNISETQTWAMKSTIKHMCSFSWTLPLLESANFKLWSEWRDCIPFRH